MSTSISELQRRRKRRNLYFIAVAVVVAVLLGAGAFYKNYTSGPELLEKSITEFNTDVGAGHVKSLKIEPDFLSQHFEVELKDGVRYKFSGPHIESKETQDLSAKGISVEYVSPATDLRSLPSYLMLMVFVLLLLMSAGPSLFSAAGRPKKSDTKFDDVAGNEEAKAALADVVDYLRDPAPYEAIGAKFQKGVLLAGPPGTGKTLLARAVAGEAGASFLPVSGSDFSSPFVGVSGMKVRALFAKARRCAPCVIFIDEIDAIGGQRLSEGSAAAREMGSSLNALLVQMDGFESNVGIAVFAATNRIELLDAALLRSGRFDRHVHMQLPTLKEREQILRLHAGKVKLGEFDFSAVARACMQMSGADLANVVNQAALLAVRQGDKQITTRHGLQARDRVVMGDPRTAHAQGMDEPTRRILAVHEAGHALMGLIYGNNKVSRVSIIPRGRALGQTMLAPPEDVYIQHDDDLISMIRVLLGGRAAEMLVGLTQTTGASDDLARATTIAMDFVGRFGMSENGLLVVTERTSDLLRLKAEECANQILQECMDDAQNTIAHFRAVFDSMVSDLIANEEIDEAGIEAYRKAVSTDSAESALPPPQASQDQDALA